MAERGERGCMEDCERGFGSMYGDYIYPNDWRDWVKDRKFDDNGTTSIRVEDFFEVCKGWFSDVWMKDWAWAIMVEERRKFRNSEGFIGLNVAEVIFWRWMVDGK